MADGSIKIKLAVDRARNRVLFADVGSDFVDVLLSFLTLPMSAVRLVAGASSPGCLSTLCQGVSCLRESKLLRFDACHDMLLRPRHEEEFKYVISSVLPLNLIHTISTLTALLITEAQSRH